MVFQHSSMIVVEKFSDTVGEGRVFDVVSGSLNLGSENGGTIVLKYSSGSRTRTRIW